MPNDSQFLDALDRIEAAISQPGAETKSALCDRYRSIKPLLESLLPWIKRIPVFGPQLASAIGFLLSIADQLCPNADS